MSSPHDVPSLPGFSHARVDLDEVSLHYVTGGSGSPVVLLHGWPQTWYQFRLVMPRLAERHTVLAVDLRGSGDSTRPAGDYDKALLADDIAALLERTGIGPAIVAGHDIGGMVAYATAARHRGAVSGLCIMDVPLPGVGAWGGILADPRSWHFKFHQTPFIAEALVTGREELYLRHFFAEIAYNVHAITEDAVAEYLRNMTQPGAIRSGFGYYRGFPKDELDFPQWAQTPLGVPVVALGGERSAGPWLEALYAGLADDLVMETVPRAGHWVCEENPEAVSAALLRLGERVDSRATSGIA